MSLGNVPRENLSMMSSAAFTPSPDWIMSYQRRPVGSASMCGFPAKRSGKNPMLSEWSVMARKSSGRESRTRMPVDEVTSSPRPKR